MGLNIVKGNMYNWVTHTWNTVKGACPHDCSYCYMKRFGKQKPARFDVKEMKTDLGVWNYIFVGSSCDMFAKDIPYGWIADTLTKCRNAECNRYLFQTKDPYRIVSCEYALPERSVVCTTIETNRVYPEMGSAPVPMFRAMGMKSIKHIQYLTIEPIMDFDMEPMIELIKMTEAVRVNIGADSGSNNLPEPGREKVVELIERLRQFTVVYMKPNFRRIMDRV